MPYGLEQARLAGTADPAEVGQLEVLRAYLPWNVAASLVSAGLAGLRLAAGLGLAGRRPWGARAARWWAALAIGWAVPTALLGYLVNADLLDAMRQAAGPDVQPVRLPGIFALARRAGGQGIACGLAVGWALPVFVLVWMGRPAVKAEVRAWARGGDG